MHARNAGIMALGATLSLYTPADCAGRILPAIGPLCVDTELAVREQGRDWVCFLLLRKFISFSSFLSCLFSTLVYTAYISTSIFCLSLGALPA